MFQSHVSNSLMHSKHLTNKPAVLDKITCPICCVPFQGLYRPMICCQNRHTICIKCINGIIQKSLASTGQPCLCPICRQRVQIPLQSNQEMKQFVELISTLNEMYKNVDNWQQRSLRLQREVREIKQQLALTKKKSSSNENLIELLKIEIKELKLRLQKTKSTTNMLEGERIFMQQRQRQEKPQDKLPLSTFVDDMTSEKHLNLVKREFNVRQVQYLVMYDMTQLVEVNLSNSFYNVGYNNLGDEGVYILLRENIMPNLTTLRLCNNQITRLPSFKHVIQNLQYLDLSNYLESRHINSNRIKQASIQTLFEFKWQKLKTFGIECKYLLIEIVENDKVWEEEGFQTDFVEKFPVVSTIQLSNCKVRIPNTRCKRLKNTLNEKAKRPNNKRIIVVARGY